MNAKTLRQCFSVALTCWSMLLTSLPTLGFAQTTNNKPMTAEECSGSNAHQWNSELNRCMLNSEATAAREQFEKCQEMTGEAQNNCLKNVRDQFMDEDSMNHEQYDTQFLGTLVSGVNGIAVAHTLFQTVGSSAKKPGGSCISRKIMMGAGIGSFVGELYLRFMAKDKFKDLSKEYEEKDDDVYQKQIEAFNYLEKEQEAIADYAGTHATAYKLYAIAYGAAAVMAGVELTVGTATGTPKPCYDAAQQENIDNANSNVDSAQTNLEGQQESLTNAQNAQNNYMSSINDDSPYDPATGDPLAQNVSTAQTGVDNAQAGLSQAESAVDSAYRKAASAIGIDKMLSTSMGILALGGVSAVLTGILAAGASREKEQAKKNAELVRIARSKFEDTMAASSFCRSRDDLSQPRCYCYNSDGSRNSNRTNSETCQALWAGQDRNLYAQAGDYGSNKKKKAQGCYRLDGVYDPDCKCQKAKNDKGENACYKVPVGVNEIAALGPGVGLPQVIDSMNSLYSGGLASGDLQPAQLGQNAARVGAARKQLNDKLKADPKNKSMLPFLDEKKMIAALAKKMPRETYNIGQGQLNNSLPSSSTPPQLAAVLEQARKDAGLSVAARGGLSRSKGKAKKKAGFDIYGTGDKKDTAYMAKKYNYDETQNDIVEREDVSIWQVISNRYTVTGLKRLFDDDAEGL